MSNAKDNQTNQTSNKGGILKVLARLTATGLVSFGIGGAVTFDRYNSYWNQTIFPVQTVDFNILSHTLPTKLSYALIKKQPEEVQRTLNSNYNLFGLIVTDSSGQEIIAYSGKNSGRFLSWKAALDPQQLKNHPYDVLLDPPPVFAQWTYSNSRATERSATSFTNQGRVIGRVYANIRKDANYGVGEEADYSQLIKISERTEQVLKCAKFPQGNSVDSVNFYCPNGKTDIPSKTEILGKINGWTKKGEVESFKILGDKNQIYEVIIPEKIFNLIPDAPSPIAIQRKNVQIINVKPKKQGGINQLTITAPNQFIVLKDEQSNNVPESSNLTYQIKQINE